MTLSIQKAVSQDAPQVVLIHISAWKEAYKNIIPQNILASKTLTPERVLKMKENYIDKNRLFVVKKKEVIVGFLALSSDNKSQMEIETLYIHPDFQKQGIGLFLIQNVLLMLKQQGVSKVCVWTLQDFQPSNNFYKRVGFKPTKRIKEWFYGLVLTEFEMEL